jgi:hypothetical protein
MDSSEAIEQGFIPYPYMFPAVQFIVDSGLVRDENDSEVA